MSGCIYYMTFVFFNAVLQHVHSIYSIVFHSIHWKVQPQTESKYQCNSVECKTNKGAIIFLLENTFLGLLRQAIYILLVMKLYAILLNSETYCIYVLSSPCLISYNCNPSLSSFCKVVTSDKTKMWWCSHMHWMYAHTSCAHEHTHMELSVPSC